MAILRTGIGLQRRLMITGTGLLLMVLTVGVTALDHHDKPECRQD